MWNIDKINEQCLFNISNLDSGCVECNAKARDFYESVEKVAIAMQIMIDKKVDIYVLNFCDDLATYNCSCLPLQRLNNSQFKLLKEVIKANG